MQQIIIDKRFKLLHKLGSGSFGEIYQCATFDMQVNIWNSKVDSRSNQQCLCSNKQNNKKQGEGQLAYESKIYQILQGTNGVCKIYAEGTYDKCNYLVIQKLGQSLENLFQKCSHKFTYKTVLIIADQIITRLEFLHMKGIVHRDLKCSNFMVGLGDKRHTIYIIDFGLAKRYINFKTKQHIEEKGGKSLVGTARYASIASHQGFQQCRRDDLQALGYLLVYFCKGRLPWQGIKSKNKAEKFDKIGKMKKEISIQSLCEGLSQEFVEYFKYVKGLKFTSEPDYNYLRKLFKQKFVLDNLIYDYFDWEILDKQPKQKQKQKIIPRKQISK